MKLDISNQTYSDYMLSKSKSNQSHSLRDTGIPGIHIHYSRNRSEVFFRPTLKINKKDIMKHRNFDLNYFGLWIAIRYYNKIVFGFATDEKNQDTRLNNKTVFEFMLFNNIRLDQQVEEAIKNRDEKSLQILYEITFNQKPFDFESIINDIQS